MIRLCWYYFIIFSFAVSGCKSQTNDEIIHKTTSDIIKAIQEGNTTNFISLIGFDDLKDISKTDEMVGFDVKRYKGLFEQYRRKENLNIVVTELYNSLGQRLVKIPLYSNQTDTAKIKEMHLKLLFGPPNFVPLDKISGYALIKNNSDSSDFHPLAYWHR